MIIHVFTADRFHLVPKMVESFYALEDNQFFILARNKKDKKDKIYDEIFKDKSHYIITHSNKELINIALKLRSNKFVLHGVPYLWMIIFLFVSKKVNWVCWGAGASINKKNWKSVIFTPFKKVLYQNFKKIGVLIPQDEDSLKKDFGVKNITLLSYFGSIGKFPYKIEDIKKTSFPKNTYTIYLGNNSSCLGSYLPLCERLHKFKETVRINCMLNYSFKETENSVILRQRGNELYGENFNMDTKLYPLHEYYDYMNRCDIYICNVKGQSGLGAIFTSLRLGKKVFLSGTNYLFIKSLGAIIFHVDEIEHMSNESFFEELSYDNRLKNFSVIDKYLDKETVINKWKEFFKD